MAERTIYSWIHLADLDVGHGGPNGEWDQEQAMEALLRDVASKPGPDAVNWILITGDVAWSGAGRSPDEYQRAAGWLYRLAQAAEIDPTGIFVVPGNHDVDRAADDDPEVKQLVRDVREGRRSLDAALADPGDRARIAVRQSGFLAFAGAFAPWCLQPPEMVPAPEHRLFWMLKLRLPSESLRVRFVGLNTALVSRNDRDPGRIQVGKEQLETALIPDVAREDEVVIAMSHHPLTTGWLADEAGARAWLEESAHIHLSGHAHGAESPALRGGSSGPFVHVGAGAVRDERMPDDAPVGFGYNFCEVVHDGAGGLSLRVWPRRWSEGSREFRADVDSVPVENLRAGKPYASHRLRARMSVGEDPISRDPLPAAPAAPPEPPPALPEVPAVDIFTVYAEEDEDRLGDLDAQLNLLRRTGVIADFERRAIGRGAEADREIAAYMASARVVLLMLSAPFVTSDFCFSAELDEALARAAHGEVQLVPIYLRRCAWQLTKLAMVQGLPRDQATVEELDPETAFTDIAFELRSLFVAPRTRR